MSGREGGDFIFQFNYETELAQLGDEGIKANAELEKLREEIRKEAAQNAGLKKQLAAAEAAAVAMNDGGMRACKEEQYAEAAKSFEKRRN